MTASLFPEYDPPVAPPETGKRRDSELWETNFCFAHGYRTPWDQTCEAFRIYQREDCDVGPAEIRRLDTPK